MTSARSTHARRGFTVLEVMMAAALGALLVVACMAMFGAMDRTETATAKRYDEATSMARLHFVMDRVWGELLIQGVDMSSGGATRTTSTTRATATTDFQAASAIRNGQAQAQPRPRVNLDTDPGPQVKATMKAAGMDDKGSPPQRLEVVTAHTPIPPGYGALSTTQMQATMDGDQPLAARGVFELRPDAATPAARLNPGETLSGDGKGWTLWYRQLPPTDGVQTPDPYAMDPTEDPSSVRVAIGLVQCRWQVFKTVVDAATNKPTGKRELVPTLSASQLQDIPAYVEMQATTASGLSADWVFEVGWAYGPETTDEAQQDGTTTADASAAGGGPGGGPGFRGSGFGTGGPGGPGGPGMTFTTGPDGRTIMVGPGKGKGGGPAGALPQQGAFSRPGGRGRS